MEKKVKFEDETEKEEKEDRYFTMLTLGIQVMFAVTMISSIYWIIFFSIYVHDPEPKYERRQRSHQEMLCKLAQALVQMLFCLIGIIGILKESKPIITLMFFITLGFAGFNIWREQYFHLLYDIPICLLILGFLHMIKQKQKCLAKF